MKTQEAVDFFGGVKELASKLKIWPHVIYRWKEYPPMSRQYELEIKTNGALKAEKQNE